MPIDENKLQDLFRNRISITFDEFCRIMQDFGQHAHDAYFHETFRAFDRNADGYITAKEIKQTMKDLGETLTDKQAKDMLKAADANNDGKLSEEEFRTLFNYITEQATTPPLSPSPSTPSKGTKKRFSNPFKPQTE
jgi:Ca2+-binding EF-hand superfamily protein